MDQVSWIKIIDNIKNYLCSEPFNQTSEPFNQTTIFVARICDEFISQFVPIPSQDDIQSPNHFILKPHSPFRYLNINCLAFQKALTSYKSYLTQSHTYRCWAPLKIRPIIYRCLNVDLGGYSCQKDNKSKLTCVSFSRIISSFTLCLRK